MDRNEGSSLPAVVLTRGSYGCRMLHEAGCKYTYNFACTMYNVRMPIDIIRDATSLHTPYGSTQHVSIMYATLCICQHHTVWVTTSSPLIRQSKLGLSTAIHLSQTCHPTPRKAAAVGACG
jgi:hypothetical protein